VRCSKNALCSAIPAGDNAFEVFAYDRIVGRLNNRRQQLPCLASVASRSFTVTSFLGRHRALSLCAVLIPANFKWKLRWKEAGLAQFVVRGPALEMMRPFT
jgi:hypothetical protein